AAPLHHAMRGHRRIDAAREKREDRSAGADRQAVGSWIFFQREEGFTRSDIDVDFELRVLQVDRCSVLLAYGVAENTADLRGRDRERLVRSLGAHGEAADA